MRGLTTLNDYFDNIFSDLNRMTVGFEPTFRMLDQARNTATPSYPPYNLEKVDEHNYCLSMAVAGFCPEDIEITLQDGTLTIEGKNAKEDNKNYLYKGIAGRSFKRVFYLNAYIQVKDSNLDNGILTINFVYELPEAMKPRKIAITSTSNLIENKNT